MNIQENSVPIKTIILDDSEDYCFILKMMLNDKGHNDIYWYSNIASLMENLDESSLIFIVDFHISDCINGAQACIMIKEEIEYAEFISVSSLLSPDEYETLINTSGCNAISRKDDVNKISILLQKAQDAINKKVKRAMEISLKGKAIIEQIEKF